jgi:hypothetical protein
MNSIRLFALILLFCHAVCAETVNSRHGALDFEDGSIKLNGVPLVLPKDSLGREIRVFPATEVLSRIASNDFIVLRYRSATGTPRERGFLVIDLKTSRPILSNLVAVKASYSWDDNNYTLLKDGYFYFGLYMTDDYRVNRIGPPNPKQFTYHAGYLKENSDTWLGPSKPDKYIVPEKTGSCFNVANVPECIGEIERDKARKNQRRNKAP